MQKRYGCVLASSAAAGFVSELQQQISALSKKYFVLDLHWKQELALD